MAKEPNYSRIDSFYVGNAVKYSIPGAIIIERLRLIEHQSSPDIISVNGRNYLRISYEGFSEEYPYMTPEQVRYAIDKLIEANAIIKIHNPENKFDRTNYYALSDEEGAY